MHFEALAGYPVSLATCLGAAAYFAELPRFVPENLVLHTVTWQRHHRFGNRIRFYDFRSGRKFPLDLQFFLQHCKSRNCLLNCKLLCPLPSI